MEEACKTHNFIQKKQTAQQTVKQIRNQAISQNINHETNKRSATMSYEAKFNGWDKLTIYDLIISYRKAKADCFFENTFPTAIKFAEYEQSLLKNLDKLLKKIKKESGFSSNEELLGKHRLIPKKLSTEKKTDGQENGHVHFSKPEPAVENLFKNKNVTAEFRIVGDFPVESHIISALWINMIGHKFDEKLDKCCYGARLKRKRNEDQLNPENEKTFNISAIGSFNPYFEPYKKWRNDGLKAIRDELEKDKEVIAVSLDLKGYYHFIDPTSLVNGAFIKSLNLKLSDKELDFTKQLTDFLKRWSDKASQFGKLVTGKNTDINGGLVIGLTCSRVISNVLLHNWDRKIIEKITPIHYGRYVDDMFLVMRDTSTIKNSQDLMQFLQARIGKKNIFQDQKDHKLWGIQQGKSIQGNTKICLQSNKQKLFILQGRAGLDLLDSIEKEIYELSSEHRLMPSPDQLEHSTAAKVLSAAGSGGESADTLRRADGLTVRRLGWSLQLRHVETLAQDLPPNQWKEQREEFYQFAHNHILRADNLFSHFSYLPRLLGFAISMNEWKHAENIAIKSYQAIDNLASEIHHNKKVRINGCDTKTHKKLWSYIKGTLTWLFVDAATRYYDPINHKGNKSKNNKRLTDLFLNQIISSLTDFSEILGLQFDVADFHSKAPLVALSDLAREPYKSILNRKSAEKLVAHRSSENDNKILELLDESGLIEKEVFDRFIKSTKKPDYATYQKNKE